MTRSASTPVFPGAPPEVWAAQVTWNQPASMPQPPAEGASASVFLDAPAPDRTGAAFLQPGTPNTDWARQPAGLTNEELRRNLARMEAESAAASGAQTPGVEIEIDADGKRRRVPPRGATTRPSRPTSPPRSRPTEQQPYTPMSMAASTQATDEVLNDAAIRLAMSNQNNAGIDVEMVAKPTIEEVISTEEAADAGDVASVPKVPPMDAPTYAAYWFSRRLPEGFLGARIPWETQGRNRRVAGWCAHPCTCAGCPYVAECRELTSAGRGRCLRPIIIGNGVDHYDHHCAACAGLRAAWD